jgi:hypothetical protein
LEIETLNDSVWVVNVVKSVAEREREWRIWRLCELI